MRYSCLKYLKTNAFLSAFEPIPEEGSSAETAVVYFDLHFYSAEVSFSISSLLNQ